MAIKIKFDAAYNPEPPTVILAKRSGYKLGILNAKSIEVRDVMNDASEISFTVHKNIDGKVCHLWNEIKDFRLVFCPEWNMWFEITVELNETNDSVKTVTGTQLGVAELSQTMLYNIQINTETDIARDDYDADTPTLLYREDNPSASLLHRITEKAPHYSIRHIDDSLKNLTRILELEFDGTSIYDAFQEIAEQIGCIFVLHSDSDIDGNILREYSVYDLESNCMNLDCKHRGEFSDVCPECGGTDINEGYGKDTTIFVTSDELADEIQLSSDTDEVKNCFKLEAGDDLMTATIRNCNPNGTDYIWHISDSVKEDMSQELVDAIEKYDELYNDRRKNYVVLNEEDVSAYNDIVKKYQEYESDLELITSDGQTELKGYSSLMNAYYNTVDLGLFLTSSLMPDAELADTDAQQEATALKNELTEVAVSNINVASISTINSAILSMAKVIVDARYDVDIYVDENNDTTPSLDKISDTEKKWVGKLIITHSSYDDEDLSEMTEEDKKIYIAVTDEIAVSVNGNYETFIKQKIDKKLNDDDVEDLSISGLFEKEIVVTESIVDGKTTRIFSGEFCDEIKKYCLNRLTSFLDACAACIEILEGSDGESWADEDAYDEFSSEYYDKQDAIIEEIAIRDKEFEIIESTQNVMERTRDLIHNELNFENYITNYNDNGESLWVEFCSFRREDKYSNEHYVSDGYSNEQLFKRALEFIQEATDNIYKSAELQHEISTTLLNLLVIEKFKPLVNSFEVGNWLRVLIDGKVFKLRLIEYTINYDDLNNISVNFSDVVENLSTEKKIRDVLAQASSMATSYSYIQKQVNKTSETLDNTINNWFETGLDTTNIKIVGGSDNQTQVWDENGMLFREYNSLTGEYEPTQLKIINSTIALTDDDWDTVKMAIGNMYYTDPITGELVQSYGINAETIVGKLFVGENLILSNDSGTLTFDDNGLIVRGLAQNNDTPNRVVVSPNQASSLSVQTQKGDTWSNVLSIDEDGNLVVVGNITANNLVLTEDATFDASNAKTISGFHEVAFSGDYTKLINKPMLHDVATSGDYTKLINQPTISTYVQENDNNSVSGGAVYNYVNNYALSQAHPGNENKFMYVDENGSTSFMSINDLKLLLGI